MNIPALSIEPVAITHSCFTDKFGIPRQPLLADASRASLELLPPYSDPEAVSGLEQYTHLWLTWQFHQVAGQWSAKVRPPRLGGNKKMGVFATRSPFRPNNIGLSVVRLIEVRVNKASAPAKVEIIVAGADLLNGTPILDIKPYIPYADNVPEAASEFADAAPAATQVNIPVPIAEIARNYQDEWGTDLLALIQQVLAQDPKPAYQQPDPSRIYGMELCGFNLQWRYGDDGIQVAALTPLESNVITEGKGE
ncbi:tRNA (N6-threonylcarbamoyladenosine(37)-N6)-methyltransferase TrmO [Microbulbifer agarilyticus]|uniref:tRNA (N6-threonylcarbamoyladenosine(37)-N6)-methyltransferase TrmO n=1 Tax=Microbulbifer agarilyticus TaxID=260552 RepID=UPI001CD3A71E|nr:tRNA (N6-threonylcarbamoyladenosine(37)-N6)-methyltransferase TrmO [Microbulbifer agarilyticus]MCA0901806.1 tRNA (N6-threonylcarbamoyladenosine(37)-N6)-methyltransferase TrmO [Microbulbifer agarilyticus]